MPRLAGAVVVLFPAHAGTSMRRWPGIICMSGVRRPWLPPRLRHQAPLEVPTPVPPPSMQPLRIVATIAPRFIALTPSLWTQPWSSSLSRPAHNLLAIPRGGRWRGFVSSHVTIIYRPGMTPCLLVLWSLWWLVLDHPAQSVVLEDTSWRISTFLRIVSRSITPSLKTSFSSSGILRLSSWCFMAPPHLVMA